MRVVVSALLSLMLVLVGCAELSLHKNPTIVLDGIPIHGPAHQIATAELRTVVGVDQSLMRGAKIYRIEVMTPVELHVYHAPRNPRWEEYQVYRRIAGKWRIGNRVADGSILFP